MFSYRFRRGVHVEFQGREYVIEQRLPSGYIRIKDIALNESKPIAQDELLNALFDGQLEFLGECGTTSSTQRKMVKSFVDDLSMLEGTEPSKNGI